MKTGDPTSDSIERFQRQSLTRSTLNFALHQVISAVVIPVTAPSVLSLIFNLLMVFGHSYSSKTFYSILSRTPYFPVQTILALILGCLLGRALRHRSMLWVWVLPLAILCYAVATATVLVPEWNSVLASPGIGQSRFSYYFGSGCQTAAHCLDQLLIVMPFYSSLAYSIGALLSQKTFGFSCSQDKKYFRVIMCAGLFILVAFVVDLAASVRQGGWHISYLFSAVGPIGLGSFLLFVGTASRRQMVSGS